MKTKNLTKKSIWLLLILGMVLFPIVEGAGFGSTYLPKIDNIDTAEIPIGSNFNYFIYPQNFENKTLLIHINFTKGQDLIKNQIPETFEILPNTQSDDFPIEIIFGIDDNQVLIGKRYEIEYKIQSAYKGEQTSGGVAFSPIGYAKEFTISVINKTKPVILNTTQNNTQNATQQTTQEDDDETATYTGGSGTTKKTATIKNTTKSQTSPTTSTISRPEDYSSQVEGAEPLANESNIIGNGISVSDTPIIKGYLAWIIVGIFVIGLGILSIKVYKKHNQKYFTQENETNNEEIEEIEI